MTFDLEKARDLAANPIHCPETDEVFREAMAEIVRLWAIIDTPAEERVWKIDLDTLNTSPDDAEFNMARRWHAAYRKAQNSNLVRAQEIERLGARIAAYEQVGRAPLERCYELQQKLRDRLDRISAYAHEHGALWKNGDGTDDIIIAYAEHQAAEIERLRADLEQAEICIRARMECIDDQAAYIKELEDALAEYRKLGKTIAGKVPCLTLHGDCGRCSTQAREVCGALEQIAGGKIEPGVKQQESDELRHCHSCGKSIDEITGNLCKGDYLIGSIFLDPGQEESRYDPPIEASYYFACCDCSRSWQITDERKAALEHILICHHCRYDDSGCKAPDVLQAMLQEAGQE